jgi:muconate cycloisomerase
MLFRLYGLRDFKLKLGMGEDIDRENLRLVHARLGKAIAAGKCTLRVDVNGGWDAASTPERVAALKSFGVCVVEQPVYCPSGELVELARRCELPLMADESLVTMEDAATLIAEPRIWWNIRLSKNGGLGACVRLAEMARKAGVKVVAGCMVGESGILSAAQRRLLQVIEPPTFVEGNFGRFLLKDDLTSPSPRFGYGGRLKVLRSEGLGVRVDSRKLRQYATLVKSLRA